MTLEALQKPRINIKDFVLTDPKQRDEIEFDPGRDINQAEQTQMLELLARYRKEQNYTAFAFQARKVRFLFHNKIAESTLTDKEWNQVIRDTRSITKKKTWMTI